MRKAVRNSSSNLERVLKASSMRQCAATCVFMADVWNVPLLDVALWSQAGLAM